MQQKNIFFFTAAENVAQPFVRGYVFFTLPFSCKFSSQFHHYEHLHLLLLLLLLWWMS